LIKDSHIRLLLTGSTGFLGAALTRRLVSDTRYRLVTALRREVRDQVSGPDSIIVGDIDVNTDWGQALSGIEVVVHSAARVHVMNDTVSNPLSEFRKVNVEGTLKLARQAASRGVRRFIFISSIKVNGESTAPGEFFTVDDKPYPVDPYSISKWEAEVGLQQLAKETGMEVVIIRPPLVYGPGVKGNIATMIKWIKKGVPMPFGSVNNQRSFVAIDNLVSLIALCADLEKSPGAANHVFLVSDGEDVSTTVLLKKLAKAYGKKLQLIPVPVGLMRFAARILGKTGMADRLFGNLQVDSSKAQNLLGWEPVTSMNEQLAKMSQSEN